MLSESFYITISGVGISGLGLLLYYCKSICLTSRCTEISCLWGGLRVDTQPIESADVENVITHEQTAPVFSSGPSQSAVVPPRTQSAYAGSRLKDSTDINRLKETV